MSNGFISKMRSSAKAIKNERRDGAMFNFADPRTVSTDFLIFVTTIVSSWRISSVRTS